MKKYILPVLAVVLIGTGVGYWLLHKSSGPPVSFKTEPATRGELVSTVTATGTLEPEDVIDVGAQVAGLIKDFGTGSDGKVIDYGSPVDAGTVLARIDDSYYRAKAEQSRTLLQSAQQKVIEAKAMADEAVANTNRARADLNQAKAKATQSSHDWDRARGLKDATSISQSDYDAAQSTFDVNNAAVGVSEAALAQCVAAEANANAAVGDAEAAVETAKAVLAQDEINLGYCTITSNVKGTIIDRRVTIGQTVQSSFNTPSLFLIAKDLTRMTVWASVNEADIGQIHVGQAVKFTVDAYPNQTFTGKVSRIRLNATNTQNVVVYTVEVSTDNPDGKLLPYMTANLQFEVDKRSDAMMVPNSALRYTPSASAMNRVQGADSTEKDKAGQGIVWTEEAGKLQPVKVQLGLTDGTHTEVVSGELQPGAKVVVGESAGKTNTSADTTNPFAPPKPGGKK
jgi:HlyD family secretion protein